jgi:hypothetical protein
VITKCEAFSASVCDRTVEQSLTSSQVGGGHSIIDADSIFAMAESRVATERQYLSSSRLLIDLRRCEMRCRSEWW